MRFILLAFALFIGALFISDPQAFGVPKKFQLSGNGRVVSHEPDRASFDLGKISEFGAGIYAKLTESQGDSRGENAGAAVESGNQASSSAADSQVLSAIEDTGISGYDQQLVAISNALHERPEATAALMQSATQACLSAEAPGPLVNYFSGLVQVVALTAQLPQTQQVESFKAQSAPLTQALKAWLKFMPDDQRAANTAILQDWAARPKDLVACHLTWLTAP